MEKLMNMLLTVLGEFLTFLVGAAAILYQHYQARQA